MHISTTSNNPSHPSRSRKTIALTVWSMAVLSLLYWSYLYLDYGARMPAESQQATGRIYPYAYKGRIVYVSGPERRRIRTAGWVFVGSMVAVVITFQLVGRRSDRAA